MRGSGQVAGAFIDELRWRKDTRQVSIIERVAWMTTFGLAMTFLGAALGNAALKALSRRVAQATDGT